MVLPDSDFERPLSSRIARIKTVACFWSPGPPQQTKNSISLSMTSQLNGLAFLDPSSVRRPASVDEDIINPGVSLCTIISDLLVKPEFDLTKALAVEFDLG